MQVCPNCGEENPDKFRLCGFCGTSLAPVAPPQATRKTVTIVFSDLKGSTTLGERLDTESLREVLSHYFARMQEILERHGGTVEKYIGDAIMAVFGLPVSHEDDALRGVRAAAEMKMALVEVNRDLDRRWGVTLANRTGVNTGEVVAGDVTERQHLVTGDTVNTAARLEQAAPESEVLIGEPTYRLVRDAVEVEVVEPLELKGKAERVPAYRLISVREGEGVARRHDLPMVGRVQEMAALMGRLEQAAQEQRCQMVTVIGEAGVGKSRLIQEFVRRAGDQAAVLHGRCLPYGDGITFWPLAEAVRAAGGVTAEDSPEQARAKVAALVDDATYQRVAAAIGLTLEAFPMEETFWGVRKFLESLARTRPVVLFIDDIHWAEPTLLDLLEHVVDSVEDAPVMVLCSSRHDLLDVRPTWGAGRENAERIILTRLTDQESSLVVENVLGGAPLPEDLRQRIIKAAEGNPLFVEQMLSVLLDEGLIAQDAAGNWVVNAAVSSFTVPPTISALITARLDRLAIEERAVVERGAVVGPVFYRGAVAALSPEPLRPLVDPSLVTLAGKQLIRSDTSELAGEDAFRFQHVLIRDSAYQGLLKRSRIELHEAFADWLQKAAGSLIESEEVLGYHLEQAYRYRTELGTVDKEALAVGYRAAQLLSSAGRRALARGDVSAAANLLDRAVSMLAEDDPIRFSVLADLGEALKDLGEFTRAADVLTQAMEGAVSTGDRRLEKQAMIVRLLVQFAAESAVGAEDVLHEIEAAVPVLEETGDRIGLVRAWRLIAQLHNTAGRYGAGEHAILRAIDHANAMGDRRQDVRNLPVYATCAVYGPATVTDAIVQCQHLLEEARGDRRVEALLRLALAQLHSMQGDFDKARELYRASREILVDLGDKVLAASTSIDSARVEMLAEDHAAAEAELRRDYEALDAMGEKYYLSTIAGLLAHALYLQGRDEEAEAFSRITEATDEDDVESQSLWRRARSKVLARRGQLDEAEALGVEAMKLVEDIDSPVLKGNTLMDVAEVLELAGRSEEAVTHLTEAVSLFDRKGNVVSSLRGRSRVEEIGGAVSQG